MLNTIKYNELYGTTLYYVTTYKKTIKVGKEVEIELPGNIYLGINYDKLYFLTP